MTEPKEGLKSLGLDNAIRLRWVLRDIKAKRLKFSRQVTPPLKATGLTDRL